MKEPGDAPLVAETGGSTSPTLSGVSRKLDLGWTPVVPVLVVAVLAVACSAGPVTTPTNAPTTTPTSPPGSGLSIEMSAEITRLVEVTEKLRGLAFDEPPTVIVLSDADLEERVRAMIDDDLDTIDADAALYDLLGLLPPGTDLAALYRDLYGEEVVGFYDGDTGELVIPADTEDLTPFEEATLVHELTHALVDEQLGMWDAFEELVEGDRFDEASALLALIEGDATLTQLLYIADLPPQDQQSVLAESFGADTTTFATAPAFLQGSLVFPYEAGLAFVERIHGAGGFAAVNEAYSSPPLSTEQVLTPGDYPDDVPVVVPAPAVDLAGYEVSSSSVWGELGFRLMFEQVLGGRPEAATGWAGDSYTVWTSGTKVAFAVVVGTETPADAVELASALTEYISVAMSVTPDESGPAVVAGDDFAAVTTSGTRVVFVAASDPAAGEDIRVAIG